MDPKCIQNLVERSLFDETLTFAQTETEEQKNNSQQIHQTDRLDNRGCSCRKIIIGKHTFKKWAEPIDLIEVKEFSPKVLEALGEDDLLFIDNQRETCGNLYLREAQDFKPSTLEKLIGCAEVKLIKGYRIKGFLTKAEPLLKVPLGPHRCNYCLYRSRGVLLLKTAREARRAITAIGCAQTTSKRQNPPQTSTNTNQV